MPSLKARSPRTARSPQMVEVRDLTGGLDLRRSPTLLAPNRARTLKNYSLEEPGALITRAGYTRASSASLGSARFQGGQRVYLASTVFSLVAYEGVVYKPTDAWAFGAGVYSTISTATQVYFPFDRDLVAVMDSTNRPRKSTDGTTWTLMGITAPSTSPILSTLSTGGLSSGEYEVAVAFKDRGLGYESNVSSGSTITITASSGALAVVAGSTATDAQVDAYVWYARHKLPDAESVLRKVSSGAASTLTITSSAWTSADEAPTNHDVPPGLQFAVTWKSRWWAPSGSIGNRLHFTELFLPQAWPTSYYIDIPFEKGDSITAVQALGDTLIVNGQSGAFLIVGQTALDFEVRPSQAADAGALGHRAVMRVEQSLIHASADGVDSFDGGSDRSLEHDLGPSWRDLITNTASSVLTRVATVYNPLRQEAVVAVPRLYPSGAAGEFVLNLDRSRDNEGIPSWTTSDRPVAFYIHWNGNEPTAGDRGRLFFAPSTGGIIFEANVGTSANSSNVTAEYEGPALSLGLHRARVVDLHVEYEPHGGAFSVEPVVDGVSQGSFALPIGSGLYTYGSSLATYGTATYGGTGRRKAYLLLPLAAAGRTVTLKSVYVGQEQFRWFGYAFTVLPEPKPRQLSE